MHISAAEIVVLYVLWPMRLLLIPIFHISFSPYFPHTIFLHPIKIIILETYLHYRNQIQNSINTLPYSSFWIIQISSKFLENAAFPTWDIFSSLSAELNLITLIAFLLPYINSMHLFITLSITYLYLLLINYD